MTSQGIYIKLAPVVQKLDSAIHWISALQRISVTKTNRAL